MVEPRPAKPTKFVDEWSVVSTAICRSCRSFEAFKQLHLGLISEVKRKSLPPCASGLDNAQSLHHFLESPWQILFSTTSPEAEASVG